MIGGREEDFFWGKRRYKSIYEYIYTPGNFFFF